MQKSMQLCKEIFVAAIYELNKVKNIDKDSADQGKEH